MMNKIIKNNY